MQITIEHLGRKYKADLDKGIDLSSTLGKTDEELRAWNVSPVEKKPVQAEGWVGSVNLGSSVNFYDIKFNPHGNGTHTESFGHISKGWESINEQVSQFHYLAHLVNLPPINRNNDQVVTLENLQQKIKKWNFEALIIKTGNYGAGHDFSNSNPPYFEPGLLQFIKEMGVQHFLTDLPSVDKEQDDGKLASHKAFWDFPGNPRIGATISEMLLFPEVIKEGLYLLNLQLAPFHNDATPSRPVVYEVKEV